MKRLYFEESQLLRQTRWVWLVVLAMALILAVITSVLILSSDGLPSEKSLSNSSILLTMLFSFASLAVAVFILLSMKLETRINGDGIQYRFIPNKPRWNTISKTDIAKAEVRRNRNIFATGVIGYHRNVFRKMVSITISGNAHLWLNLKNNQTLMLGTQRPEELERALKRLLSTETDL